MEGGLEFHASYLNDNGTGHTTIVSNPNDTMVDIVITQFVCNEVACEVSLCLPVEAAAALGRAMGAGISVALQNRRATKYN